MKKIKELRTAIFLKRSDKALELLSDPEVGRNINDLVMGETCLYLACRNGLVDVAKALLTQGADIEKLSDSGRTPLHGAAKAGQLQCVQLLVRYGADVTAINKKGQTAYDEAKSSYKDNVVKYLAERMGQQHQMPQPQNPTGCPPAVGFAAPSPPQGPAGYSAPPQGVYPPAQPQGYYIPNQPPPVYSNPPMPSPVPQPARTVDADFSEAAIDMRNMMPPGFQKLFWGQD